MSSLHEAQEDLAALPFHELTYCPYGSLNRHSPYVETPIGTVRRVIQFASLVKGDIVLDLGCGAGDFINALVSQMDGLYGIGIDCETDLIAKAKEVALTAGVANQAQFFVMDFFKDDVTEIIKKASYVYVYLTPRQLHEPLFKNILTTICLLNIPIISYSFAISYLKCIKFDEKFELYLYQ